MNFKGRTIVLILDNLRSVYNVASLFRTADCFGISRIYLCGTTPAPVDRFGRVREDFRKVALGAELTMSWEYTEKTMDIVKTLQSQGCVVGALEQSEHSVVLHQYVPEHNYYAIVLGAEVVGVDPLIIAQADVVWEIGQYGSKESLNVCMAGAVGMYHLRFMNRIDTL